ncbi:MULTISPECIES: glycosyltransferase [unclassified Petrotoga]|uniref:glycosyltransferase n=1 Tax=unclassified Petrotoga TaxID=2620614 RepID=UPI000EF161E3|nr:MULTISPECIES: glycosyltransferase [unclassified Petrotoga]
MNLLYAGFIREESEEKGILTKMISQCLTFKKVFDNVYLYISRQSEAVLYSIEDYGVKKEIKTFSYPNMAIYNEHSKIKKIKGFIRYNSFLDSLYKIINSYEINALYLRNLQLTNKLIKLSKRKKLIKIIEIPTYPFENEIKKATNKIEYNLLWKNREKKVEDFADIIVPISSDKALNLSKKFVLISNGIRLEDIKIKNQNQNKKASIHLLSIANLRFWHGYDRIIKGLYEYYKNNPKKDVYYHCVGEGPVLENLKNSVKEFKLEKYVIFHGTKVGEELDKIVDDSDIAFGSLGNHRKGLYSDSALKNREYCARGIPFVIASNDQDFQESFPYVFRIPKDDSPVDINKIINWYEDLSKKHPNYSLEMRKYAEENLSWDTKVKPVIEKIKELVFEKENKAKV